MTNKEREIYENAIRARKDLAAVNAQDAASDIEGSLLHDNEEWTELTEHHVFLPNLQSRITFTGQVKYEAEKHKEQDWDDNFGAVEVDIIDKVYDCVLELNGVLTATCGNEMKTKQIKL